MQSVLQQSLAYLPTGIPVLVTVRWHPAAPNDAVFYSHCELVELFAINWKGDKGIPKPFWRELLEEEIEYILSQLNAPDPKEDPSNAPL